jgi:hypothetical protein
METVTRETPTLDPWYITGFVDGEGSFTYSRSGNHMELYFAVRLSAKDKLLLEKIQKFFHGIGHIYAVKARGKTKECSYYRVTRLGDLKHIIAHFDKYPLNGKKNGYYGIWRKMVEVKLQFTRKQTPPELEILANILSGQNPGAKFIESVKIMI